LDILTILLIALGDSADCFAVAVCSCIAMKTLSRIQILRVALSFGIFQTTMTILGWLAGRTIVDFISGFDHWLAFLLLAGIGGKMIWESFHGSDDDNKKTDVTKGLVLVTLSLATSIDALAVGLSFAFLDMNIPLASGTIGVVAFIITIIGFLIGKRAGKLVGERAELVGGIVLIAIGLRILITHLAS
jgi:manganese efflux pump family protein